MTTTTEKPTKRKAQARGNERRKKLLEAASTLLLDKEFDEISMADIAKQADIPTASCYTLFNNTNAIFAKLASDFSRTMALEISSCISEKKFTNWREFIDASFDTSVSFYQDNHAFSKIMLTGKAPAEVRYNEERIQGREFAVHLLKILESKFHFPTLHNPQLLFTITIDLVDGILTSAYIREKSLSPAVVVEAKRAAYGYLSLYLPDYLPLK